MKICDEFIGKEVEILHSPNKTLIGLKGKIVDETKNTFKVLFNKKVNTSFKEGKSMNNIKTKSMNNNIKTVLKHGLVFNIDGVIFKGDLILKRPEDRIKLKDQRTDGLK